MIRLYFRNSFLLAIIFCLLGAGAHSGKALAGSKMPVLSLPEVVSGKIVNTSVYDGKVRLVVFFATWCMPCMMEVPSLKALQADYGPDKFTVIALSVDEGRKVVVDFVDKYKVKYPVLHATRKTPQKFGGVPGLPTSFLVDKDGNVLMRFPGLVPHSLLDREVKRLFSEEKPPEK